MAKVKLTEKQEQIKKQITPLVLEILNLSESNALVAKETYCQIYYNEKTNKCQLKINGNTVDNIGAFALNDIKNAVDAALKYINDKNKNFNAKSIK